MDVAATFESYRLTDAQAGALQDRFTRVVARTALKGCGRLRGAIEAYRGTPGLYLWTMCHAGEEFKIYLGRAGDLARRVENYLCGFQAHSPNDFKLQLFVEFLAEVAPAARLNYYVAPIDASSLNDAERAAVREYRPLLNKLQKPSEEAKRTLAHAFGIYYRSCFERTLARSSHDGEGA